MIQYEYFNATLLQNTALKIQDTVGTKTPPAGKAFGVLSALTNLETVSSSLVQEYSAVQIHTLNVTVPTEAAVAAYVEGVIAGGTDNIGFISYETQIFPEHLLKVSCVTPVIL